MAIWYTADTHFGHENILSHCKRPFSSVSQMDAMLLENMWKRVAPEDELWILGDFAFGAKAKDPSYLEGIFHQLPGSERHLIVGNHDLGATLQLPWTSVSQLVELQDGSQSVPNTLCHYPMITWNHARKGALQLFGHVHNNWKGSNNAVNVGVDVWDFMPISFSEVAARARKLPKNKHWDDVEPRSK